AERQHDVADGAGRVVEGAEDRVRAEGRAGGAGRGAGARFGAGRAARVGAFEEVDADAALVGHRRVADRGGALVTGQALRLAQEHVVGRTADRGVGGDAFVGVAGARSRQRGDRRERDGGDGGGLGDGASGGGQGAEQQRQL